MKTLQKLSTKLGSAPIAFMLCALSVGFAAPAQARDNVYWSIGIGSPSVDVNVANAFPVYIQPSPVYVTPRPVYVQPPPVYVQPWPSYYYRESPPVVYFRPGDHEHWRRGRGRWHHEEDED